MITSGQSGHPTQRLSTRLAAHRASLQESLRPRVQFLLTPCRGRQIRRPWVAFRGAPRTLRSHWSGAPLSPRTGGSIRALAEPRPVRPPCWPAPPWTTAWQGSELYSFLSNHRLLFFMMLLRAIPAAAGSNPVLPHYRQILYQLSHKGSPRILEGIGQYWVPYPSRALYFLLP